MKLTFTGKNVLIPGGSCEMGICLAEFLINENLFPMLTYRNEKGRNAILKELSSFKGKFEALPLDLGDPDSIDTLFKKIDSPDFLVDFAQSHYENFVASASRDDVYTYFEENVSSRAEIIKRVARVMLEMKRGRLVFISSAAAQVSNPGQGFYAASKCASEALYKNAGLEMGRRGITSVILRPGYADSGRGRAFLQANKENDVLTKVPIRRTLTVTEIAEAILFFLSDSASGFNAAVIPLDGGLTACKD